MTNQEIFDLISRFEGSSLTSLKLKREDCTLELSRAAVAAPTPQASVPAAPSASADVPAAEPQDAITAPLVGTYYAASAPGEAPFVRVGDTVKKGQTVCLIEAMKMISEIPAPCDCVITEILKENGALCAFHEPLFRYKPC